MRESSKSSDQESPTPADDGPGSGYLYHQQEREPRSRRASADRPVPSSQNRPSSHHHMARAAMVSNLKTTGVVLGCMLVLLLISMYVARTTWDIKNERMVSQPLTPAVAAQQEAGRSRAPAVSSEEEDISPIAAPARKQLDTDAIRQAVFLSQRAASLASAGQYKEAIERYRQALKIWPYLTKGWAEIGRIYLDMKDYRRAQISLERAVQNDPGAPDTLNDLGVAHLFQNNLDKALDLFQAVNEIDPSYPQSYFNIALCHLARNEQGEAIQHLRQYLRLRPDDPRALKELAYMYANDQNYRDALNSLQVALTHAPEWPPLYFDAAATSALMGRTEQALRYLDKAEILTTPAAVYQIYQQPAFKDIRLSELGKIFEKEIADRAREAMLSSGDSGPAIDSMITEPLSSGAPAI